jgi:hypothetical protein
MNMDFMHFYIMFFNWIKDSMIIWCDNIDIKEDFLRGFWWPNFFKCLELWFFFFTLSPFFSEGNNLKAPISVLSYP